MTSARILGEASRLAALIGPLPLSNLRARSAVRSGTHSRRRAGSGSEFWQFRTLQPGEPSNRVDWRRSARSDELFVREREQEDPVQLCLDLDGSGSMRFASDKGLPEKWDRGAILLTALAVAAREANEQVVVGGRPVRSNDEIPISLSKPQSLGRRPPGSETLFVFAGDFLDEGWESPVEAAVGRGSGAILFHIVDPAEDAFPFTGHVRFEPSEDGEMTRELGRADALAESYQAAWSAHLDRLQASARRLGCPLVRHNTGEPAEQGLSSLIDAIRAGGPSWAA